MARHVFVSRHWPRRDLNPGTEVNAAYVIFVSCLSIMQRISIFYDFCRFLKRMTFWLNKCSHCEACSKPCAYKLERKKYWWQRKRGKWKSRFIISLPKKMSASIMWSSLEGIPLCRVLLQSSNGLRFLWKLKIILTNIKKVTTQSIIIKFMNLLYLFDERRILIYEQIGNINIVSN